MRTAKKIDLMILIVFIVTVLMLLASCKSSKTDCDAYGYIIDQDTVTIVTEHVNFEYRCSESVMITNVITDTIYLQAHEVQFN